MLTGTLEELSNQRRSKKIGDGTETKETELNVLQRQWQKKNERLRMQRERNRARHAAQTASERQANSKQRSTCEWERMAAETPEERERKLQKTSFSLLRCFSCNSFAVTGTFMLHIETVNYHSILCKTILV